MTPPKLFMDGFLGDYLEVRGSAGTFGSFTWSFRLPPGIWWWQWAVLPDVVTDANVNNRSAYLLTSGTVSATDIRIRVIDEAYHTAGNTRTHLWWPDCQLGNQGSIYVVHRMPAFLVVPREHLCGIGIAGTQAGDSAPVTPRAGFWRIASGA